MRQRRDRRPGRGTTLALIAMTVLLVTGCTGGLDTKNPVTDRGDEINRLFDITFVLSFIVMAMVFSLLLVAMLKFRGAGEGSLREGWTKLEIVWTAIPTLLLTVLFVMTVRTMMNVTAEHAEGEDVLHVNVVGNQWWWSFEYPELGIVTANELYLPVDRPVELTLNAKDVIHSFWVPEIGWKMDMLPGHTNTLRFVLNEAGEFDGACTEFCGAQHAWMRIKVIGQEASAFEAWSAAAAVAAIAPSSQLARDGEATFLANSCATCHTIKGVVESNNVGPDLTHFGNRETIGAGVIENSPENLRAWIENPDQFKPGVLMPSFTGLSDEELDALVAYLEGLR